MDLIYWNNPGKKLEKTVYNPILGTLGTLGKSFSDFSATVFFSLKRKLFAWRWASSSSLLKPSISQSSKQSDQILYNFELSSATTQQFDKSVLYSVSQILWYYFILSYFSVILQSFLSHSSVIPQSLLSYSSVTQSWVLIQLFCFSAS